MHRAFRQGLFNGNILVADHGKIVYKAAIGFADAGRKTRLTEQYRFHIGSIAKEFNAVGIMLLKEQGKLNLDDKVSQYLPELPSWAGIISIRDLLQYTSGLPDIKWETVRSDVDNLNDLQKLGNLDFEPGSRYAYNNNNVFLQRRIIEKITGLSFQQFVMEKLLEPSGMNTAIIDPAETDTLVAHAFNNDGKRDAQSPPISGWTAVTLDDFFKWANSIINFKLISPAATAYMLVPISPSQQSGLGLGGSMKGDKIARFMHDGVTGNYQALLVCEPPKERIIILMTNNKQNNLGDFNTAIQNILDGRPYIQPKKQVFPLWQNQLDTIKGERILSLYHKLKKVHQQEYAFDAESTLNELGYALLSKNRVDDAIVVFEYNTHLFPTSGNVFDSLGEAYYKKGDKHKALLNYKRSLILDPGNTVAKSIIAELEK
jgi:CubicO group peptidase (beta-lactamase class C family)